MGKYKIQIFIENLVLSFLTMIKILLTSHFFLKKPKDVVKNEDCLILGNSPSLEETIKNNPNFLKNKDLFAVNFFWKSKHFTQIKPRNYIIVSTNYWAKHQIAPNREGRLATFKEIAKMVDWEMFLFVPALAKSHKEWKIELEQNKNITIVYFNVTPVEGFTSLNHFFFKTGLGMPRPHNVLIPSLKFAIDLGYKNAYLIGAEHSWLKELFVGEDNKVYLSQKHFYDAQTAKAEVMYKGSSDDERNLSEVLMKFVHSFNSYYVLDKYAKSNNVLIYNATKDSYIDAFERFKLS